jgi:ABC-2 type transport system ATP-binding protein
MKKRGDILVVSGLSKSYDGKKVVDQVSFSVAKGEIFGILGPNGAGKTTTIEMIETLRPIDSGSVTLDGLDVNSHPSHVRQVIGVQLQSSAFFDFLYLPELLVLFGSLYGQQVDPMELLKDVHLESKSKSFVKQLSGGQKQRFSIASALVNKPKVLFLDEPTTGLDPQARRNLWALIKEINSRGISIVMTTHYLEEAELLCDRVAIMDEGVIIALDSPDSLIKDLLKRGFTKKKVVKEASLEDVFIDLTGKELRD